MQNGSISLSVTGGTAPYTFTWSNQATTASITNLAAGYYSVRITDSSTNDTTLQFTLTQPEPLALGELVAYEYANGFHVSMFGACNGSASAATTGGILPYTYFWKPGNQTIAAPNNLCAGENILTVTDMNGCEVRNAINLKEPQRDDWTMTGNAYSNSSYNFIGTTDSTDLVFKTNNNERLRIYNNGITNIKGDLNLEQSLLFKNNKKIGYRTSSTGIPDIISYGADPDISVFSINSCSNPSINAPTINQFNGTIQLIGTYQVPGIPISNYSILEMGFDGYNSIIESTGYSPSVPDGNRLLLNYYCGRDVFVGNANSGDLTANRNMLVNGKLGIGISQQDLDQIQGYQLIVEGKAGAREVRIVNPNQAWPDYVFDKKYKLNTLSETEKFIQLNKRLPGFPQAAQVEKEGQNLGQLQVLQQQKLEELYLHIIALEKRINTLEKENKKLKSTKAN